jgi:threonine dehydrogenase-like Zn-dependent dehydrogenase
MSAPTPDSMRVVVLPGPGGLDALTVQSLPVPAPREGWVLIRVRAAGINRSELHTAWPMSWRSSMTWAWTGSS